MRKAGAAVVAPSDLDAASRTPEIEDIINARFIHPLSWRARSEEHTSELQSLMRSSYAVFCLKKKTIYQRTDDTQHTQTETHPTTQNSQMHNPYIAVIIQ